MTKNPRAEAARDIYHNLAAIRGQNYARCIKYNATLLACVKRGRDKAATTEMTNMLSDLAAVWGVDVDADDYKADLASFLHTLGVIP